MPGSSPLFFVTDVAPIGGLFLIGGVLMFFDRSLYVSFQDLFESIHTNTGT